MLAFCSRPQMHYLTLILLLVATVAQCADTHTTAPASSSGPPAAPQGLSVRLWAGETMLANPVAFTFDEEGRMFVAETYRQGTGVSDNRGHLYSLPDDLAAMTFEDRLAKYEKWKHREPLEIQTQFGESIRLLQDTNGDGVADKSTTFAGPFNEMGDGTAAGILAKDGDLWFTCIPHLWRLRDTNNDGVADEQTKVYSGFGVRDAFRGHDLHGLILGPDGWLYFTVADRGYNIPMPDGSRLTDPIDPGRGAAFRCRMDGSNLQVFHRGLRNPQELAFDPFGNLFTVDNNSDSGDKARLVQVVEGADSGWSLVYQYGTTLHTSADYNRGPWNAEKLWHLRHEGQAAWVLPPIAHFTDGPSGFTYNPGITALGDAWKDSFFVVDFKGDPANTGIWNFRVEPDGASFKLSHLEKFVSNVAATDCDFGPDGRFYLTDFITGWVGTGKGRVWTIEAPGERERPAVQEVGSILRTGFSDLSVEKLVQLLDHPDMRIRTRAQYALAESAVADPTRANQIMTALETATENAQTLFGKLHAVWGLSMLPNNAGAKPIAKRIANPNERIRAQAARMLGDLTHRDSAPQLFAQFTKELSPIALTQQVIALGKLGYRAAAEAFIEKLSENDNKDLVIRHALSLALSQTATAENLTSETWVAHPSDAVRLGVLLALRHQASPSSAAFLKDPNPLIVLEAARAIYDLKDIDALPQLASLLADPARLVQHSEPLILRVLNAAAKVGSPSNAIALSNWALLDAAPVPTRQEALHLLATWAKPEDYDRVLGYYRPQKQRPKDDASSALSTALIPLLNSHASVVQATLLAAADLQLSLPADTLAAMALNPKLTSPLRSSLLDQLDKQNAQELSAVLDTLLSRDDAAAVQVAAASKLAATAPDRAIKHLLKIIESAAPVADRQAAIASLGGIATPSATQALSQLLESFHKSTLDPALHLDVIEAAEARKDPKLAESLARIAAKQSEADPLATHRVSLQGGDVDRGQDIFTNHLAAQCMRCHKVKGGGGMAGPELSKIGIRSDATPEYLLESLLNPSAAIVPGYGMATVQLTDGRVISGTLTAESDTALTLVDANAAEVSVALKEVALRTPAISSMPPMGAILSKREIRHLIAYLRSLGQDLQPIIE